MASPSVLPPRVRSRRCTACPRRARPRDVLFVGPDERRGRVSGAHKSAGFPHSGLRDARTTRRDSRTARPRSPERARCAGASGSPEGWEADPTIEIEITNRVSGAACKPQRRRRIDPGRRPLDARARPLCTATAGAEAAHPGVRASPGVRRRGARRVPPPAPAPHRDGGGAAPERGVPRRRPGGGGDERAFIGDGDVLGTDETTRADERRTGTPSCCRRSGGRIG